MASPEGMTPRQPMALVGSLYNERRGLIDCEAFLHAIGLDVEYKEAFIANFGRAPKLESLRRRLTSAALSKMGIQDFLHQKTILKHLRALPVAGLGPLPPCAPPAVPSSETEPSEAQLPRAGEGCEEAEASQAEAAEVACPASARQEEASDASSKALESQAGDTNGGAPADPTVAERWASEACSNGAALGLEESMPLDRYVSHMTCSTGVRSGESSIGSGVASTPREVGGASSRGAAAGGGGGGGGSSTAPAAIGVRGPQHIPLRATLLKDKDNEKLIRSTWDHIKTMQKEMDQEVITKRTEKIDRIRAGQRITEEEADRIALLLASNLQGPGAAPPVPTHPPHPPSEVCRRGSGIGPSSSSSSSVVVVDPSVERVKDTQIRSLNYGNCALRMSLIERHLLSVQSRIVEEVRKVIGCERASLMFVDQMSYQLIFFIGEQLMRLPLDKGIAGRTAQLGEVMRVEDAYSDPDFNPEVDKETGFRTVNILSFPVRQRHGGKVVAVIQMLNKDGGFTPGDVSAVESCSMEVADLLEECIDTLATATAQWDRWRCTTVPRPAGSQRNKSGFNQRLHQQAIEEQIRRLDSLSQRPSQQHEWNAAWGERARLEGSMRLKRRTDYGRNVIKNQYGL